MAVQCERVSHEHLQLQTECRKTFSRSEEIESLRKKIIELNEQISHAQRETENTRSRLSNQEKLVNEVRFLNSLHYYLFFKEKT